LPQITENFKYVVRNSEKFYWLGCAWFWSSIVSAFAGHDSSMAASPFKTTRSTFS
jgi:hypothetical protein